MRVIGKDKFKIIKQRWASFVGLAIGLGIAIWLNETGVFTKEFIATPSMAISKLQWFLVAIGCAFLVAFPILGWFVNAKYERVNVRFKEKRHKKY